MGLRRPRYGQRLRGPNSRLLPDPRQIRLPTVRGVLAESARPAAELASLDTRTAHAMTIMAGNFTRIVASSLAADTLSVLCPSRCSLFSVLCSSATGRCEVGVSPPKCFGAAPGSVSSSITGRLPPPRRRCFRVMRPPNLPSANTRQRGDFNLDVQESNQPWLSFAASFNLL